MQQPETQFIEVGAGGDARRIAYLARGGGGPGIVWLGGFKSDMTATKASVLDGFAADAGRAMTRLDYSGHGASGGAFADGTIGRWLEEAQAVLDVATSGPQILVGSSMGGWLALLLARARPDRVQAIVLIAPAPDMTDRLVMQRFTAGEREAFARDGFVERPSDYGPEPYLYTRGLVEEGRRHLMLGAPIAAPWPVRILHGIDDPDVPWTLSSELIERLDGPDATLTLVKHGDHRLSKPENLDLLARTVAAL